MAHARSSVRRSPRNQKSPESKDAKALPLLSADICVNYDICLKHGTRNCGVCAKEKSPETTMIPKRQVITPTFRPAPFYSNSGCAFKRPLRYIKYKSPIIEYDCADRDYQFVDLLNQEIRDLSNNVPSLKYRELERVIDCLENLAFCGGEFFEAIQEMRNKKTKHNRCCICVSTRNEELLQCSKCSIFVHLSCYRSSDICADDEWLCDWCQFSNGFALHETPSSPKCVLCSHTGGAMKRTDHYELWCHVVCFENHPSTSFDELSLLVTGAETTPLPSYFTHCSICETLSGSPIQCMEDSCTTPIHLYCSHQQIQQLFSSGLCEDSPFNQLFLTCTKHTWSKWMQTRLSSCTSILSDDQVEVINEEIVTRGAERELPDAVLSLIFEYWMLLLNPNFPEKFLLPSLSVAKNMERMEERWEELEGSNCKKSKKSRYVKKKRTQRLKNTSYERKRQGRMSIRPKKRVSCKISRQKPRCQFKSGIVPFTIPVSSNVSLNAPEGTSFSLSASAFARNFDAKLQANEDLPPVTITVSVNGIKSKHCTPKRRHSYFTRRKNHPPNHWSTLRAKVV